MQNYADVRDKIENGYLVFFKAEAVSQKAICWVTGGEYSHAGILFWMYDHVGRKRLMLLESRVGGTRIVNFSAYAGRVCEIINVGLNWDNVADYALAKTGVVHYGLLEFIPIGLRDLLTRAGCPKMARAIKDTSPSEVCSETVADIMRRDGFAYNDTLMSPNALYNSLRWRHYVRNSSEVLIG